MVIFYPHNYEEYKVRVANLSKVEFCYVSVLFINPYFIFKFIILACLVFISCNISTKMVKSI